MVQSNPLPAAPLPPPPSPSSDLPFSLADFPRYFFEHLGEEMAIISGAPVAFIIAAVAAFLIAWLIFRFLHQRELATIPNLNTELALKDAGIARLKDRLAEKDEEIAKLKIEKSPEQRQKILSSLTPRSEADLIAILREYKGDGARVQVQLATRAVSPLASNLASVFQSAGWETEYSGFPLEPHTPAYYQGVEVRGTNQLLVDAVIRALSTAGLPDVKARIEAGGKGNPKLDRLQHTVRIIVGHQV